VPGSRCSRRVALAIIEIRTHEDGEIRVWPSVTEPVGTLNPLLGGQPPPAIVLRVIVEAVVGVELNTLEVVVILKLTTPATASGRTPQTRAVRMLTLSTGPKESG